MSKSATTLETALDAVRRLPTDVQEAIASDMIEAAEAYNKSCLTKAQRASAVKSLNKPHKFVSADMVTQTLRRYQHP